MYSKYHDITMHISYIIHRIYCDVIGAQTCLCTIYSVHCTLYIVHRHVCALITSQYILCTLYSVHCTLFKKHRTTPYHVCYRYLRMVRHVCAPITSPITSPYIICILYDICIVMSLHLLYDVQCTLYNVHAHYNVCHIYRRIG